jgi:hypothetical protein
MRRMEVVGRDLTIALTEAGWLTAAVVPVPRGDFDVLSWEHLVGTVGRVRIPRIVGGEEGPCSFGTTGCPRESRSVSELSKKLESFLLLIACNTV